jgi:toxin FitB
VIILDTNVISELMAPSPAERVDRWVAARPAPSLYTTAITQAEILFGILLLPKGKRRERI